MREKDFMSKVRTIDHRIARWLMRHFYFTFFQLILLIIFIVWLSNTFSVIDIRLAATQSSLIERILVTQSINTAILVLLLLLNSFWLLFVFNGIQRINHLLRDINYHITRIRFKNK